MEINSDDLVKRCREIVSNYEKEGVAALENLNFSKHAFDVLCCFFEKDEVGYKKIQEQIILRFLDNELLEIRGIKTFYHILINYLTSNFVALNYGMTVGEILDIYMKILGSSILNELKFFLSEWAKKFPSDEYDSILLEMERKIKNYEIKNLQKIQLQRK